MNDTTLLSITLDEFCKEMYKAIQKAGTEGQVAWTYIKPLIRGRVLYSPDTPETRAIMERVCDIMVIMFNLDRLILLALTSAYRAGKRSFYCKIGQEFPC